MVQYRESYETSTYQFDKIEKDIIEDFLMEENLKSRLERGTNKYSWHWSSDRNDEVGTFSVLLISEFVLNTSTKHAQEEIVLKIIPVDKFDRIVQTSDQRKKYSDRIMRTQEMNQKMIKKGIKLKSEQAEQAKIPNFAPISDPEFLKGE